MRGAHVQDIALVVGHADYRPHSAGDAGNDRYDAIRHGASDLMGTRDGRLSSNNLKILLYSSVHDDGRMNA